MRNCKGVRELLPDYMDGLLDDATAGEVKLHIDKCAGCTHELSTMQAVVEAMKGLDAVKAPRGFESRLKERINARPRSFFNMLPLMAKVPAGVAALAITTVLAAYMFKSEPVVSPMLKEQKAETVVKAAPSGETAAEADKLSVAKPIPPAAPAEKRKAAAKKAAQEPPKVLQKPEQAEEPLMLSLLIRMPAREAAPQPGQNAPAPPPAALGSRPDSAAKINEQPDDGKLEQKKDAIPSDERLKSKDAFTKERAGDLSATHQYKAPAAARPAAEGLTKADVNPLDAALSKIIDLLPALDAKVLSSQAGHRLIIDIPADNYDTLLRQLQSIGVPQAPSPRPEGAKTLRVQITLVL
ncbi:MAG: zf-HC2 domain-containing protein [Nitrospirae bacterium]|nr:zf-HC2 domain-containing protein [Nitrospirota bacterium]